MKKAVIGGVSILVLSLSACGSSSDKIQVTPTKTPTTVSSGATQAPVKDTSVDTSTVSSNTTMSDQDADSQKDTASSGSTSTDTSTSSSSSASNSTDTSSTESVSLTDDDSTNILKAFQDIYANKDPIVQSGMVLKTENLVDGKYFKGSVTVGSRDITNVFAIKRSDAWKVVSFGSDTPDCKWLSAFPADMSSGCLSAGSASGTTSASGQVDASATGASFQ